MALHRKHFVFENRFSQRKMPRIFRKTRITRMIRMDVGDQQLLCLRKKFLVNFGAANDINDVVIFRESS